MEFNLIDLITTIWIRAHQWKFKIEIKNDQFKRYNNYN